MKRRPTEQRGPHRPSPGTAHSPCATVCKQRGYTELCSLLPLVPTSPQFLVQLEHKQSLSVSRPSHHRQQHIQSQPVRLEISVLPIHSPFVTHPQRTYTTSRFRNVQNTQSSLSPWGHMFEPTATESNKYYQAVRK